MLNFFLNRSGVLYISYDGILEPLGQSQVLSYLESLAKDRRIFLISFEKKADLSDSFLMDEIQKRISDSGIEWHFLTYHKTPSYLATAWDILRGTLTGLYLTVKYRLNIIHARSYVPALIAVIIKKFTGVKFLFDMRGFWADERLDGKIWKENSLIYRISKYLEMVFLKSSDHVVSLTKVAVDIMLDFDYLKKSAPPFTVIPTCADLERFQSLKKNNSSDKFVMGYLGTAGTWYLFEETAKCISILIKNYPNSHFYIINRGEHKYIKESLIYAGVPEDRFTIKSAKHSEVPQLLQNIDAAIFFIKPVFSKKASAPTKLAEFLGSGIPCLVNDGVGDMGTVVKEEKVGVAISDFTYSEMENGINQILQLATSEGIRQRCMDVSKKYFSLEEGVKKYQGIYESFEQGKK